MKFQFKIYSFLFFTIISLGWINQTTAQRELFTVLPENTVQLNTEQAKRMSKIDKGGYAESTVFVKMGHLPDIQKDGELNVTIPIVKTQHTFRAYNVRSYSKSSYSWSGNLVNDKEQDGRLSIHAVDKKIFGHVELEAADFRLVDLSGGLWVFIQIKDNEDDPANCGNSNYKLQPSSKIQKAQALNNACKVSVLVLYTQAADNEEPDMWQLAYDCIQTANDALINSAVSSDDLRFKLAGVQRIDLVESNNINRDLWVDIIGYDNEHQWNNNTNSLPTNTTQAQIFREQYNADVVIIFTDKDYEGDFLGVSALPYLQQNTRPYLAFAMVDVSSANTKRRRTFTHELGHIMDLWHENEETQYYPRGYEFQAGGLFGNKKRKTLMHRLNSKPRKRILHFSNPDVEFKDEPTGVAASGSSEGINSARRLGETGCAIANFAQDPVPPLSIGITFTPCCKPYVVPGEVRTYTANIANGQSPFQHEWRVSTDGFNYGSVLSTTDQLVRDYYGYQNGDQLFVKVKVTDNNGEEAEEVFIQYVFEE